MRGSTVERSRAADEARLRAASKITQGPVLEEDVDGEDEGEEDEGEEEDKDE